MFCYCQCAAMDPVAGGDDDEGQSIPSIETTNREAMLEQPPLKPQTVKVSNTDSLLILCYKHLSFKLHVKGECKTFEGSTLL